MLSESLRRVISWEPLSWKTLFSWNSLGVHLRKYSIGEREVSLSYSLLTLVTKSPLAALLFLFKKTFYYICLVGKGVLLISGTPVNVNRHLAVVASLLLSCGSHQVQQQVPLANEPP